MHVCICIPQPDPSLCFVVTGPGPIPYRPKPEPPSPTPWCPRWGRPALHPYQAPSRFSSSSPSTLCPTTTTPLQSTLPANPTTIDKLLFHVGGIPKRKLNVLKEEAAILSRSAFNFVLYSDRAKARCECALVITCTHTQFFAVQWCFEIVNPQWLHNKTQLQWSVQPTAPLPPSAIDFPLSSHYTPPLIPCIMDPCLSNIKPFADSCVHVSPVHSPPPTPTTCLMKHTSSGRIILTLPGVNQGVRDQLKREATALALSAFNFVNVLGCAGDTPDVTTGCSHTHFFGASWRYTVVAAPQGPASQNITSLTAEIIMVSSRLQRTPYCRNSSNLQPSPLFVWNHSSSRYNMLTCQPPSHHESEQCTQKQISDISPSSFPALPHPNQKSNTHLDHRPEPKLYRIRAPLPQQQTNKSQLHSPSFTAPSRPAKCGCTSCSNSGTTVQLPLSTSSPHTPPVPLHSNPYTRRSPEPPYISTLTPKIWPALCSCRDLEWCRWCILGVPPVVEFITPLYQTQLDRYHNAPDAFVLCPCTRCAPNWLKIHQSVLWEHDFLYDTLCGPRPKPPGLPTWICVTCGWCVVLRKWFQNEHCVSK